MIRGLVLGLVLLLTVPPIRADDCAPYHYQAGEPSEWPTAESFLLEINTPDVPPSYLLGTLHSAAPEVLERWSAAVLTMPGLRLFVTERDFGDPGESALRELPPGQTLVERLGDEPGLHRRVTETLRRYRLLAAERWQPWFVAALLNQAPGLPPHRQDRILDVWLLDNAKAMGFPIRFLESFADIAAGYRQLDGTEQHRLLWEAVCNQQRLRDLTAQQITAYANNDVATLQASWYRYRGSDPALTERLGELFIGERNAAFWASLQAEFSRGGVFVAVGATHVFGADALLARLIAAGFTAQPLDPAELDGAIDPARLAVLIDWVRAWLTEQGLGEVDAPLFDELRVVHRSLPELRRRLCPGQPCSVETSYLPATRTVLVETGMFARLLVETPQDYPDSLLVRELVRHALYQTHGDGLREQLADHPRAEDCLRSAVLHQAARAQHARLEQRGSGLQARPFVRDARCPVLF